MENKLDILVLQNLLDWLKKCPLRFEIEHISIEGEYVAVKFFIGKEKK